jgi:hypothetical protein
MRGFWRKKGEAVEKWRSKAWSIDLHKTKLTIVAKDSQLPQHVPPWTQKKRF